MFNKPHHPIFYSYFTHFCALHSKNPAGSTCQCHLHAFVIRLTQLTYIISLLLISNSYNMSKPYCLPPKGPYYYNFLLPLALDFQRLRNYLKNYKTLGASRLVPKILLLLGPTIIITRSLFNTLVCTLFHNFWQVDDPPLKIFDKSTTGVDKVMEISRRVSDEPRVGNITLELHFIFFISKIRNTYNENMIRQLVFIKIVYGYWRLLQGIIYATWTGPMRM